MTYTSGLIKAIKGTKTKVGDFPRLEAKEFLTQKKLADPFIGLVYYLEKHQKIELEGFLAQKYSPELFDSNEQLLADYFEFLVHEETDKVKDNFFVISIIWSFLIPLLICLWA